MINIGIDYNKEIHCDLLFNQIMRVTKQTAGVIDTNRTPKLRLKIYR